MPKCVEESRFFVADQLAARMRHGSFLEMQTNVRKAQFADDSLWELSYRLCVSRLSLFASLVPISKQGEAETGCGPSNGGPRLNLCRLGTATLVRDFNQS